MSYAERNVCTGLATWFALFAVLLCVREPLADLDALFRGNLVSVWLLSSTALSVALTVGLFAWWGERPGYKDHSKQQAADAAGIDGQPVSVIGSETRRACKDAAPGEADSNASQHAYELDETIPRHRIDSTLIWRQLTWMGVAEKGHVSP